MGKKGTWISAIKSLFTSKDKLNEGKEKKGIRGKLKHGSLIPRFREPSSIEKILGEVDQHKNLYINIPQTQPSSSITSPPPTLLVHHPPTETKHLSATRIQAAYRGYVARKKTNSKPPTTGLMRLQGLLRGQQVKRQTVNAMKQMQLLVRLQTQIHSRRIHMVPLKHQPNNNNNKQQVLLDEYWDDSLITKEERQARLHRKAEAAINRERAMTYAYSHQLPKNKGIPFQSPSPWWWSRLERQFPCDDVKNPPRSTRAAPHHLTKKQTASNNSASASPMSSRSMVPPRTRMKYPYPIKDDDSLMSCPAFSVPNYMTPTLSAKAKARPSSNPKDRMPATPGSSSERRLSFPPTPNSNASSSFNWKKGSSRKHKSPASIGELSTDSASSVLGRRKAFNRFV